MRISDWSSDVCSSDLNNPVIQTDAEGHETLTPYHEETLCEPDSITFADLISNQTTQARDLNQRNKQVAGGVKYNSGGLHAVLDAAYQTSDHHLQNVTTPVGQRIDSMRSEEHTSELQSLMRISYAVFCLNKKKQKKSNT